MAAVGVAEEDREPVADQLATTAGEDGRQAGRAESHLTRRLFGGMVRLMDALAGATG